MQKYITILFLLLLVAVACSEKRPENILLPNIMEAVLTDMHVAEGFLNTRPSAIDSLKQLGVGYREEIYKKHQTNQEQFTASFDYYNLHPEELDSIYADVITNLSKMEVEFRK
jgi:hypothetical protein